LNYQVIRSSRRKTIALQIKEQKVIVRAPYQVSDAYIHSLVLGKREWIDEKLNLISTRSNDYKFVNGRNIVLLGNHRRLLVEPSQRAKSYIDLTEDSVITYLSKRYFGASEDVKQSKVRLLLEGHYKRETLNFLNGNLASKSQVIGLSYSSVKVRKYKSRWGSCNSQGELSFNSLLSMLPVWVMEYVIVHELCHLRHLNHSRAFWDLVAQHCEKTQAAKNWLKQNAKDLTW